MQSHLDTIVALSTPEGIGAIAVIRLSGPKAIEIGQLVFEGKDLSNVDGHTLHFGRIISEQHIIDEVLVGVFKGKHSYTGEDTLEISCHGSPYIIQRILNLLIEHGARAAQPGEFTLKAFLNGKLDLSQAEAVADLIASESAASHKIALQQLRGGFSTELKYMRDELITFASLLELELDFSEEDVEFANRQQLDIILNRLNKTLQHLISSFELGNVLKKGIPVAIIGKPNAGKSTLLNRLLNEDRAIVSSIAGTTRDTLEEQLNIQGVLFRLIDTAGIRESTDEIELIGVERAQEKMRMASIIIYLFDPEIVDLTSLNSIFSEINAMAPQAKILVAGNKSDQHEIAKLKIHYAASEPVIWISARDNHNIELLKNELLKLVDIGKLTSGELIINNTRHLEALQKSRIAIEATQNLMQQSSNSELLAFEIKEALYQLGLITGEVTTDDLLDSIFSKFCIGK